MQGVQLDALAINFDQQSTLARLLAKENITVIHGSYKTAWFDPQKRVLGLPIWKNKGKAVYDLLTGHEVGHALYTPAQGWHDAVDDIAGAPKAYLNVLEDVRIERKVQDRYPGLRFQFRKAYKILADEDFFGINKGLVNLNMVRVIDKINVKSKLGEHVDITFDDDEREFYHLAFKTETFEDVVALAKKIYEYQKALQAKNKTEQEVSVQIPRIDNDMDDEFEMEDGSDYEKPEIDQQPNAQGDSEEDNEDPAEGKTGTGTRDDHIQKQLHKDDAKTGPDQKGNTIEPDLDSITDKAFRDREKELVADRELNGSGVLTINSPRQKDIIIDYKEYYTKWKEDINKCMTRDDGYYAPIMKEGLESIEANFKKFKIDTEMAAAYMAKEFELRKAAYQYSRSSLEKTGIINTNKLHAYKFSEDIFLKSTKLANYKNHGMMLFIDFSGSMSENIGPTIRQMLNLAAFCRMINVPYEMYAFTTRVRPAEEESDKNLYERYNDSEVILQQFNLLNLLSSRMSRREYSESFKMLYTLSQAWDGKMWRGYIGDWNELHSTPLNSCIVHAHKHIKEFKAKNQIEKMTAMFLTDGESDSFQVRMTDAAENSRIHDGYSYRHRNAIVRFNGKSFETKSIYGADMTKHLLRSLNRDANTTVLGFFISEYRNQAVARALDQTEWAKRTELKLKYTNQMNKNRCLIEDGLFGYDRYFGLCTKYIDVVEDEFGELVEDGASKTKIKTAFAKATKSRRVNRILLNAFVDAVA